MIDPLWLTYICYRGVFFLMLFTSIKPKQSKNDILNNQDNTDRSVLYPLVVVIGDGTPQVFCQLVRGRVLVQLVQTAAHAHLRNDKKGYV